MGKKTDFILNAITLGGRTRKKKRQAAMSTSVQNNTPTETTNMLNTNFDNMELSALASALNELAKDVSEEVNEFSDIQAAIQELDNNLTLIKNQAAVVKFAADLCFVDVVTLEDIEQKTKEVGQYLPGFNRMQDPETRSKLKNAMKKAEELFNTYNSKRIAHINQAITKSTELEKAIKGSSKIKTDSSVSNAKNDTLGSHLSTIATMIKKDSKNVVTDLEFLSEQIYKFDNIYVSVSNFINSIKNKGIAVEKADKKMTDLVSSMIATTGAILNHSGKHADAIAMYDRAKDKYNKAADNQRMNQLENIN